MPFSGALAYARAQSQHENEAFARAIMAANLGHHGDKAKLDPLLKSLRDG